MALPKTHPEWIFEDNPNKELQKDVDDSLLRFGKEIYLELKGKVKYGDKSPLSQVFTMSTHAYEKRYESEERYMIDCVMAIIQYEYYSRRIKLGKQKPTQEELMYLDKIIEIAVRLRNKWKLPGFQLHDDITYLTVQFTLDRLKELTVGNTQSS